MFLGITPIYGSLVKSPGTTQRRRPISKMIVAVVAVLVATACGSASGSTAVPATSAVKLQVSPESAPAVPIAVGAESTFVVAGATRRVAVLGFDPVAGELTSGPVSGGHWASADVRTCIDGAPAPVSISRADWSLLDGQNGRYPSASPAHEQFPSPEFPYITDAVAVGDCVRGWVLFAVGNGVTTDRVQYTPNPTVNATWSTTGAVDIPAPTSPSIISDVSDSVVAVGQSCSRTSAVGVDVNSARNIVCVNLGSGRGPTWVNSVPIVGFNGAGDVCNPLMDRVSQTSTGLAVMCVGAAWRYGP